MSASVESLTRVPLFAALESQELEHIANRMVERRFRAGDTLTQEGAPGIEFFVVEEGVADVDVEGEAKGTVGPGGYFGEIALFGDLVRTATITAETDMVCYTMAAWEFKQLVENNPAFAWKILTAAAEKMR